MTIPSNLRALIERLNQELNETEQEAITGLSMVRPLLSIFVDNAMLVRHFAYFNNILLFIDFSRRRIQDSLETVSPNNATEQEIQQAGEDLGEILGRVLEAKIEAISIITTLEELP